MATGDNAGKTGAVSHRFIESNGIRMHLAEQGVGPLVLLCHGFPESWYSWRHQLSALAEAGFHAVAPDQRGYGQTDRPEAIEVYTTLHLVGDMLGLLDALGEEQAVIVGHDWGASVAWNAALMQPDRFPAVIVLSIPYIPRGPAHGPHSTVRPTEVMRRMVGDHFFYQLYFQQPGIAEAELERDVRTTIRRFLICCLWRCSCRCTLEAGDARSWRERARLDGRSPNLTGLVDRGRCGLLCCGIRAYRLSWWPQLVSELRPELGTACPVQRCDHHSARAVHLGGE
jgi:hypothetical protein